MRRISGVVAILLILGLAAVGLIYAQKNTAASSSAVVASGSTAEFELTRRSSGVAPLTSQSRERTLRTRC